MVAEGECKLHPRSCQAICGILVTTRSLVMLCVLTQQYSVCRLAIHFVKLLQLVDISIGSKVQVL